MLNKKNTGILFDRGSTVAFELGRFIPPECIVCVFGTCLNHGEMFWEKKKKTLATVEPL